MSIGASSKIVPWVAREALDSVLALLFWLIFAIVFLLSGMLAMGIGSSYRMGLVSFFAVPLLVVYGLRVDRVLGAYILLGCAIVASGLANQSSAWEMGLFFRILAFSFLVYSVADRYINASTVLPVLRASLFVAVLQLPVVVFQLATYDLLPARITQGMNLVSWDYDFGTFNFKGDSSMAFFVTMMIAVLLFQDPDRRVVPRWRWPTLAWLSATVLVANSEMGKVVLVVVWLIYGLSRINRPRTVIASVVVGGSVSAALVLGPGQVAVADLQTTVANGMFGLQTGEGVDAYLSGQYARGAALYYFANRELLVLGDGPSRYSNPINKERTRGNVGHALTMYSEVGLLGLACASLVFLVIVLRDPRYGHRVNFAMGSSMLIAIHLLSFTNQVMNDISVVLAFVIAAKSSALRDRPTSSVNPSRAEAARP